MWFYLCVCGLGCTMQGTVHTNLATCLFHSGQHRACIAECTAGLGVPGPHRLKALYRRALAYTQLGSSEAAEADLTECLEAEPGNAAVKRALTALAQAQRRSDRVHQQAFAAAFGLPTAPRAPPSAVGGAAPGPPDARSSAEAATGGAALAGPPRWLKWGLGVAATVALSPFHCFRACCLSLCCGCCRRQKQIKQS